jgi:uncharacterized radical SAM superfamily Fe-S cluster-containing enzyme
MDRYAEETGKILDKYWCDSEMWRKYKEYIERTGKGTGEGYDRIWLENLPKEEQEKVLEEAKLDH